jgi:hypothetical protein
MEFDVGIVGCGIAGTFAALRIAEKYKGCKCIVFDIGRPPAKRRRQIEGFLGCFPTGNGRIYPNNLDHLYDISDGRKIFHAHDWVMGYFCEVSKMKLIKDRGPMAYARKKIKKAGFEIVTNDHYQWKPESVHKLSRVVTEVFENSKNVKFSFDNFVESVQKKKGKFIISAQNGEVVTCKKVLLCAGRSGWRWVTDLYKEIGAAPSDNLATYGVRLEMPAQHMKHFGKSHCTLVGEDVTIGPLNWNGTVIPEDHSDLVVSAFRSNENRWKTEKVMFSLLKSVPFRNKGVFQTDRIGKLSFLLFNDRVGRERIRSYLNKNSLLSLLPEYSWLLSELETLVGFIPNLYACGHMHVPNILPMAAKIKLTQNLESKTVPNLFAAGESANVPGILGAAVSGCIAANSMAKW